MKIVVDTNILISSLIHNSAKRKIIFLSNLEFYYPEESKIEIEKYKDYIMQKSALNKETF